MRRDSDGENEAQFILKFEKPNLNNVTAEISIPSTNTSADWLSWSLRSAQMKRRAYSLLLWKDASFHGSIMPSVDQQTTPVQT